MGSDGMGLDWIGEGKENPFPACPPSGGLATGQRPAKAICTSVPCETGGSL